MRSFFLCVTLLPEVQSRAGPVNVWTWAGSPCPKFTCSQSEGTPPARARKAPQIWIWWNFSKTSRSLLSFRFWRSCCWCHTRHLHLSAKLACRQPVELGHLVGKKKKSEKKQIKGKGMSTFTGRKQPLQQFNSSFSSLVVYSTFSPTKDKQRHCHHRASLWKKVCRELLVWQQISPGILFWFLLCT